MPGRKILIAAGFGLLPLMAGAEAPRLTAIVDLAAEDGGFAAVESFAGQLPRFPSVVGLDLTVKPDAAGRLGVTLIGNDTAEPVDLECDGYGFVGPYQEVILPLSAVYPHLLLTVRLNGLDETEGLVMACEYTGSGAAQFRLQGEFVVSQTAIPTAYSVTMSARPVE